MFLIKKEANKRKNKTKQNKNNKVKRFVMRDSPCEDVLDSPATAPEKILVCLSFNAELVGNPKRKI